MKGETSLTVTPEARMLHAGDKLAVYQGWRWFGKYPGGRKWWGKPLRWLLVKIHWPQKASLVTVTAVLQDENSVKVATDDPSFPPK